MLTVTYRRRHFTRLIWAEGNALPFVGFERTTMSRMQGVSLW